MTSARKRRWQIRFTGAAEQDVLQLYDVLLKEVLGAAEEALAAMREAFALLAFTPFACRNAAPYLPRHRELVIPFGRAGYVALFEINDAKTVTVLAVRHQREADLW
jgi:plasmid stabilization system protein ParE